MIDDSKLSHVYQSGTISPDFNGNFKLNKDRDHWCTYLYNDNSNWGHCMTAKMVRNCVKTVRVLSRCSPSVKETSYVYQASTIATRDLQYILKVRHVRVPQLSMCTAISPAEQTVCWISVQCVYVTSDVCFSQSTQVLCMQLALRMCPYSTRPHKCARWWYKYTQGH